MALFAKRISGGAEWLLVCLGNYGQKYENTRHNIGFMAADRLVEQRDLRCNRLRFRALTGMSNSAAYFLMSSASVPAPLTTTFGSGVSPAM